MLVQDKVTTTINLAATPSGQTVFGVPLLLVDHADIPVHRRYNITTRADYTTDTTASTDQRNWCAAFWGQGQNPASVYLGRWCKAASAAYCYLPNATQVASVYAALTSTAQIKLLEGTINEDINPDFTGDTTMADVVASLQATMAGTTNFTGYVWSIDKFGDITLTSDNTGAAAATVTLASPASGTDLTGSAYLGAEVSVAGVDAEALADAYAAIRAITDVPFTICQRGASIAQAVAFSTAMASYPKWLELVDDDADGKDSGATTDMGYQINALSRKNTHLTYTEHTTNNGAAADQFPDASIAAAIMSITNGEGKYSWADNALQGLSESGLHGDKTTVIPLTASERTALKDKGYDYLIAPAGVVTLANGLAADAATECRHMFAKYWAEARISEEIYTYKLARPVVTFSDPDIQACVGIVSKYMDILVERKVINAGYTLDVPTAADFTAAQKATKQMDLTDLSEDMTIQHAANYITISFTWNV